MGNDPINPTALLMGWQVGNRIARQRSNNKTPVAYLYNGVRLPKLPEWDREAYPYAYVGFTDAGIDPSDNSYDLAASYCFYATDVPFRYHVGEEYPVRTTQNGYVCSCRISLKALKNGLTWPTPGCKELNTTFTAYSDMIWANYDVISATDGTVYLAASEPIPVYE